MGYPVSNFIDGRSFCTMTYGGPGSATETATFYIYRQGFVFFNTGLAAALSLIILVATIVAVQNAIARLRR